MYGFMYKDIITNKKIFVLMSVMMIMMFIICALNGGSGQGEAEYADIILPCSLFFFSGTLEMSIFSSDERRKFSAHVISLPDGVRTYVGAKYLLIYIMTMLTTVISLVMGAVMYDINSSENFTGDLSLIMFVIQLYLRAVDIPFTAAFGSMKGMNVKAVSILLIAFLVMIYLLFGDLGALGNITQHIYDFAQIFDSENTFAVFLISFFGLAAFPVYFISYKISCRVYPKGAAHYDK